MGLAWAGAPRDGGLSPSPGGVRRPPWASSHGSCDQVPLSRPEARTRRALAAATIGGTAHTQRAMTRLLPLICRAGGSPVRAQSPPPAFLQARSPQRGAGASLCLVTEAPAPQRVPPRGCIALGPGAGAPPLPGSGRSDTRLLLEPAA